MSEVLIPADAVLANTQRRSGEQLGWPAVVLLLAVSAAVLLPGLAGVSLFDRDEGWYAQVSREMVESGDWLVPRYLGAVWLAKPPLLYWLVGASFKLLGTGGWQARLVPVLATAVNVLLVSRLGAMMFGRRVGVLAGLLFVTTGAVTILGKVVLTDGPMLTCTLCAVLLHWRMASDRVTHQRAAGYWLAMGLGWLAKGPAVLVFCGPFALALLSVRELRGWLWNRRWWAWLPLAPLVAAPWFIYIGHIEGGVLVRQFFLFENLARIIHAPPAQHPAPPGYYLLVSLGMWLPWTVFLPGALLRAFRRRQGGDPAVATDRIDGWHGQAEPYSAELARGGESGPAPCHSGNWVRISGPSGLPDAHSAVRVLLIWTLVPWVVLELVRSKLVWYILPCYVPLAILLARDVEPWLRAGRAWSSLDRGTQRALALWPGMIILLGLAGACASLIARNPRWSVATVGTAGVMVAGFAITWWLLRTRSIRQAGWAALLTTIAFQIALGQWLMPAFEPMRLSRKLAEAIEAQVQEGDRVYLCGYAEPTTFFYLKHSARCVRWQELPTILDPASGPVVLVYVEGTLEKLDPPALSAWVRRPPGIHVEGCNYARRFGHESIWIDRLTPRQSSDNPGDR